MMLISSTLLVQHFRLSSGIKVKKQKEVLQCWPKLLEKTQNVLRYSYWLPLLIIGGRTFGYDDNI